MTKKFTGAVAALAIAVPAVVPAIASADATTSNVARQFDTQVRNNGKVSGIRVLSTHLRCAADGGGYYQCLGTFIARLGRYTAKYGEPVTITPQRWYSRGTAQVIWAH